MKRLIVSIAGIFSLAFGIFACDEMRPKEGISTNDLNIALNDPDKFAWQIFMEVCRPFDSKNPDGELVWERWALAREIYEYPDSLATWEALTSPKKDFQKLESLPLQQFTKLSAKSFVVDKQQHPGQQFEIKFHPRILFDPLVRRDSTANETRVNKTVYDFIKENDLYYTEGQEKFFNDNKVFDLPIESREVKAQWREIEESEKDIYHYHLDTYTNEKGERVTKIWGLVSFHIITKDIPQWTWATFEHKSNSGLVEAEKNPKLKSRDSYGQNDKGNISDELLADLKKTGMPSKWENYILRGTQTNFVTLTGEPTILANSYIEEGFMLTSSCITCHAKASIGRKLQFEELPESVQDSIKNGAVDEAHFDNRLPIFASRDPLIGDVGIPNPKWFSELQLDSTYQQKYSQTDFMWSFFRSKRRNPYKSK